MGVNQKRSWEGDSFTHPGNICAPHPVGQCLLNRSENRVGRVLGGALNRMLIPKEN